MLEFSVNGQTFEIEFRHRRKNLKHPVRSEFYAKSPVRAVTVCTIRGVAANGRAYHAAGVSVCIEPDNWSRPIGRFQSFEDAVTKCGLLRPIREDLRVRLTERFSRPMKPPAAKLSPAQTLQRRSDGQEIRLARQALREGAVLTCEQMALLNRKGKKAAHA